jgi:hypothetical protein
MYASLLAVLAALFVCVAEDGRLTEAQKAALPQYFGFGPMQIYRLKPRLGQLLLADLDADGRTDALVWNAYRSRFELFYQPDPDAPQTEPHTDLEQNELPDQGNLRREHVPAPYRVESVAVAELTGDDRPDIVFFGEPKELVILPGRASGGFGAAQGVRAPDGMARWGSVAAGDFNADGRTDVALLGAEVLMVFHQKPEGGLQKPIRLMHGIQNPLLMLRGDLNGDERDDLVIGADDDRHGAYVALQRPGGGLAALRPVRIPRTRSLTLTGPSDLKQRGDDLYAVQHQTGRLKHYRWEVPDQAAVGDDWPLYLYSYPIMSTSKQRPLALGDVDGDGQLDCLVVDPDAAQLILFRGHERGLANGVAFPGLMKIKDVSIVDLEGDGRNEVLTVSADEKMIGVSRFQDGRLTFPIPLVSRGEPFVAAAGCLKHGAGDRCLAYVTREDREFTLVICDAAGAVRQELPLEDLVDDPAALRIVDANQDGRNDLLLLVRFAPAQMFLQEEDGQFAPFHGPQTRSSLLKETSAAGVTFVDVTGDGQPEILFAQENLVRAMRIEDGRWTVVDQYNPETADTRLTGLAALPGAPGSPTLVMYEQKNRELLVQRRREDGTYGVVQTMPVGTFDLTAMLALPFGPDDPPALLMADSSKLALLMPDTRAPTLVEQYSYETDTRDAYLADAVIGDLNHDGVRDVVAVDIRRAALEILTTAPSGALVKATRFQVFQGKRFSDAPDDRGEPRGVLIGELTGDGIDDIVLIVHDRLIVYPGQ